MKKAELKAGVEYATWRGISQYTSVPLFVKERVRFTEEQLAADLLPGNKLKGEIFTKSWGGPEWYWRPTEISLSKVRMTFEEYEKQAAAERERSERFQKERQEAQARALVAKTNFAEFLNQNWESITSTLDFLDLQRYAVSGERLEVKLTESQLRELVSRLAAK